jgi:hypothetical protein
MTVCSGEEVLATVEGGAMEAAILDFGAVGAIDGAAMRGWAEGSMAGAVFGCGADGAIRETDGGAGAAKRRVNGSRRRTGAGLEIAGANTALG